MKNFEEINRAQGAKKTENLKLLRELRTQEKALKAQIDSISDAATTEAVAILAIRWRQKNEQKEQSRKYQAALTREMKGITDGFVATHPDWTPDEIKLTVKVID